MSIEAGGLQLLRSDRVGRVRTPVAKRLEILAEFQRSGMSGAAFAKLIGVKYQTFSAWTRRQGSSRSAGSKPGPKRSSSKTVRFLEAQACAPSTGLEVSWGGQTIIRVGHASQIPLAAALLRELSPC